MHKIINQKNEPTTKTKIPLSIMVDGIIKGADGEIYRRPEVTSHDMFSRVIHALIGRSSESDIANKNIDEDDYVRTNYTRCPITNIYAETECNIYKSSRTLYEDLTIRTSLSNEYTEVSPLKIGRVIDYKKYFCTDTAFPFYKNLFYVEPDRLKIKGRNNKTKTHYEINFYYELPKIFYYLFKIPFNESKFKKQYTDFEYYVLIDLFTALTLEVITKEEEKRLFELMCRDSVLKELVQSIQKQYDKFKKDNESVFRLSLNLYRTQFFEILIGDCVKPSKILRELICMTLIRIAPFTAYIITRKTKIMKFLTLNDFRYIVGFEDNSNNTYEIEIKLPYKEGCDCVIKPKIFKSSEAIDYLKSVLKTKNIKE